MTSATPPFEADGRLVAPPIAISDLCGLRCSALARMLAAGETSAVEVMAAFLDQIEAYNPVHNAIVSLRPRDELLAEAASADAARKAGAEGALLGLPVAFKDLQPTRGLRTTFGSPLFRDFVPDEDSLTVARVRAAEARS